MIELANPAALAGLAALPLLAWIARNSPAALPPGRSLLALVLRSALLVCLVLALCDPRLQGLSTARHTIWLLDASLSTAADAAETADRFAKATGFSAADATWLEFAGGVRPRGVSSDDGFTASRTELARAAAFAAASFPPGKARHLVVFTDGVGIAPGLPDAARSLARAGVRADVVAIPRNADPEAGIRSLEVPARVRQAEPFEVKATIVSNTPGRALVALEQDGLRAGQREVELRAGANEFAMDVTAGRGGSTGVVVSVFPEADRLPQNNTASASIRVEGMRRVLAISERGLGELASALAAQGINIETVPPEGVGALSDYDAVVLDSIPAERLGEPLCASLASYVRAGGGLVALGGGDSFDAGGYAETALGPLLPVRSHAERQTETPAVALALVIDKSGSMHGEKLEMAKSAALAAVEVLGPGDSVGVVAFDGAASWLAELQPGGGGGGFAAKVASMTAGGGTNVAAGLAAALDGLRKVPAQIRHAILLSDGVSSPGPFLELAERMRSEGITLSCVGVGTDADAALMEQLARRGGGRFYLTDSPQAIPQIFVRETSLAARPGFSEEPVRVSLARPAPFLRGIDFASAPYLLGHVSADVVPGASLWLALEDGAPLLVTWRVGLGTVAAFTSDAGPVWSAEWLRWPSFGPFWAQVIREVSRGGDEREAKVSADREEGVVRLRAEAPESFGRLGMPLAGEATVFLPDGSRKTFALRPVGPEVLEAEIPESGPGGYRASVALRAGDRPLASGDAGWWIREDDDSVLEEADFEPLAAFAGETGGALNPTPEELAAAELPPQPVETELWPWLAWLALALFLGDVAARRWPRDAQAPLPDANPARQRS